MSRGLFCSEQKKSFKHLKTNEKGRATIDAFQYGEMDFKKMVQKKSII